MPNAARGSKVNFITLLTVDEEGKARHSLRNIAKRLAPGRTRASGKQSIPSIEVSWLAWVGSKGSVTITEGGTQKTLLEELASGMHLQAPRLVREGTPGRRNSMSKSAAAGSARMLSGARGQRTRGSTPDRERLACRPWLSPMPPSGCGEGTATHCPTGTQSRRDWATLITMTSPAEGPPHTNNCAVTRRGGGTLGRGL